MTKRYRGRATGAAGCVLLVLCMQGSAAWAHVENDDWNMPLHVMNGSFEGSTLDATNDGSGKAGFEGKSKDVWYEYMAQVDGILIAETCGSKFDTVVSIWKGNPESGYEVAFGDDECDLAAVATVPMLKGELFTIRVGGKGKAAGDFTLTTKAIPNTPADAVAGVPLPGSGGEGGIAETNGADIVLTDSTSVSNYGAVGNIRGYAIGSYTCNIGNANLGWGSSYQGSPSLAMNAYRLHDGKLFQIGQSWVKQACCAGAGSGCGLSCNGVGGSQLGAGCSDVYSSGWNGGQGRLGPRSGINAYSGAHTLAPSTTGDAIFKRLQILQSDLVAASYPGALYFMEGVYVCTEDAVAHKSMNNASYKRVTVTAGTYDLVPTGSMYPTTPAIYAWQQHGGGAGVADNTVQIVPVDVPNEGRFFAGSKVRDLGNGVWRYDYAVYNLNSDRSGGSFSIPIPAGVQVTNTGFHDTFYHSGEPYANTDWTVTVANGAITWSSPQTYAQNQNSNALRWGTMYNFWFDANTPSKSANATLGLFKPHTPQSVQFSTRTPNEPPILRGDMNCDGAVNNFDIDKFVVAITDPVRFAVENPGCTIDHGDMNADTLVNNFDIDAFVAAVTAP